LEITDNKKLVSPAKRGRRAKGEGTIYKRSDGKWCGAITTRRSDGSAKRSVLYGRTQNAVLQKLRALRARADETVELKSDTLSTGDFLERWLGDCVRVQCRPATYQLYSLLVKRHIAPHIGKVRLAHLAASDVSNLYTRLKSLGASERMVQMVHARLHSALKQAVRWELAFRNVSDLVDPPRAERKQMRALDRDEVRRFLETARGVQLYALYVLAVTTGLRQGELLALQWPDIDFKRGTLSVRHTLLEVNNRLVLGEPKTRASKRLVTLPKIALSALEEQSLRSGTSAPRPIWVFADSNGGPLRKSNLIRRSFKPLLEAASLPNIRFHDLRHTAATLLMAEGVHPKVVQERLGHSSIGLTLDTYSHVLPSMQNEAADKLDAALTLSTEPV
jgi:integrase